MNRLGARQWLLGFSVALGLLEIATTTTAALVRVRLLRYA